MDDTIAIGISDNGVGIPSDIATMLFQKPISKSSASGSGFGLFLSKRLVNAWGGTIEVIKSDTEGATIQVTLKVWETSLAISPTKRALVVDDDLHWESIIHSLLSERGLTVDSANSLREAAHLVHTNDYDLALLDLRFGDNLDVGDTTGLNLANLIRERNPEALIVMLTAFANVSTVHDAFSAGVDEFIDKMGFSDVEMNRVLNKVAARRATERESIRQSQLNRLMYQILSMISHELRTPLLAIQRNAEALELGALGALTSEQAEAIGIIRSAVQREFVLLDAHLDLNRIERGAEKLDYQEHNLITVMREEVLAHKPEADHKNIKIRTQLPRKKATIKIDVNRFRVALNPLLDNAIKFSPEGSEIFIKVHIAKKHVEVRISDQGPGIKPEEIDRLLGLNFDETTNFTQRIRSSGLGLLMAKHIIDLHSGKLWIESDGKNGTTVSFRLPIKE